MPIDIPDGYTKDIVTIECRVCHTKVNCKWKRNRTRGIHFGRPMIELPDDWKVIYDFGSREQAPVCGNCEVRETPGHPLLGKD